MAHLTHAGCRQETKAEVALGTLKEDCVKCGESSRLIELGKPYCNIGNTKVESYLNNCLRPSKK